jgi:hypothetical protein
MHRSKQIDSQKWASATSDPSDPSSSGLDEGYLTDGETLFHVERTLAEDARGDTLVELEDCLTLELIVCSSRAVAELGLRSVRPLAGVPS